MLRLALLFIVLLFAALWAIRRFAPRKGAVLSKDWNEAAQAFPAFHATLRAYQRFVHYVADNAHMHNHLDLVTQADVLISHAVDLIRERKELLDLAAEASVVSARASKEILKQARATEPEIRQVETCISKAHEQLLLSQVDHREATTEAVRGKLRDKTAELAALAAACRQTAADRK